MKSPIYCWGSSLTMSGEYFDRIIEFDDGTFEYQRKKCSAEGVFEVLHAGSATEVLTGNLAWLQFCEGPLHGFRKLFERLPSNARNTQP
jgi:hypothetical protein